MTAQLGEGGMGAVYRARDTKLNQDIAPKVLLPAVASDPERLARFRREAQTLAALNHPHIGAIYGLEESAPSTDAGQASTIALVLELVEGPTLADRIARGPIPVDEALAPGASEALTPTASPANPAAPLWRRAVPLAATALIVSAMTGAQLPCRLAQSRNRPSPDNRQFHGSQQLRAITVAPPASSR